MTKIELTISAAALLLSLASAASRAEDLPPEDRILSVAEGEYYELVDLPVPAEIPLEAVSFIELPNRRLVVGTRRGDIYFVDGSCEAEPAPRFHRYASGLHEVFGLAQKDGMIYATQQCEVTRIKDTDGDGEADRFETVNDLWGFGGEHEFTYGSKFDKEGNLWTVHCLTGSYTSENLFRGWCLRVTAEGEVTPTCSGIRSPGGIGMNAAGDMFYTENQGPWNGACSLKHLKPGGFMGHPLSFKWYDDAPNMGRRPAEPRGGRDSRQHVEGKRIPQLVPPAVVFPYRKMGQSASAIVLDASGGKFGPFEKQLFVADYTLSLVMRVYLENVDGVYQGACFPFRQGFKTGLVGAIITKSGYYIAGGTSRGWPARGPEPYCLQRLQWTGKTPFEVHEMRIRPDGFELTFTLPVDRTTAADPGSYVMKTYTHYYQRGYGSPEVDHTRPRVERVIVGAGGRGVRLVIDELQLGHVHELQLSSLRAEKGTLSLLHDVMYYTVNRIPSEKEPSSGGSSP